jgi:hypothetical protein
MQDLKTAKRFPHVANLHRRHTLPSLDLAASFGAAPSQLYCLNIDVDIEFGGHCPQFIGY